MLTLHDVEVIECALQEAISLNAAHEIDEPREDVKAPLRENQAIYRAALRKMKVMESAMRLARRGCEEQDEDRLFAKAMSEAIVAAFK